MSTKNKENVKEICDEMQVLDGVAEFKVSAWGYRHQQCLILFFCLTTAYSMRACMGVSLVAMVESVKNDTVIYPDLNFTLMNETESNQFKNISYASINNITENDINLNNEHFKADGFMNALLFTPPYPIFKWNKQTQDMVLAAFFYGYMVLQIPAGQLAHRFGARRLLTGAMMINCVVSFCFPWATYYGGWICSSLCRLLQGLSQACIVPGLHTFFGKWAPLEERARLAGFTLGGQALGSVLGLPVTGFLAASPLGWPGIFRFFGILSGCVGVLVFLMIADTPSVHPKISTAERRYIEEGMGQKEGYEKKHLPVPWMKILRCRGVYAIVIAHIGQTWGQLTLYSEVPAFMNHVMKVNIKANGMLTAFPFLMMWFSNFFWNWFTDMLIVRKIMNPTNARKVANSIGCVPIAIGLVVLAFVPKNIYVVELILVIVCVFKIASHVGFMVNHIDISPNFAGTTMSLSNFASNLVGSQAPLVAGAILTDVTSEHQWRIVFLVSAGLYFFTNLVYVALGTAELADWNQPPEDETAGDDGEKETGTMLQKPAQKSK